MRWAAINEFRKWSAKRKGLLQGLIGVAVESVASCVPGGGVAVWSTRIIGEFAKHGVDRLADTSSLVPEVKSVGQSIPAEQLDQLNGWLASLSTSYAGLLDRLDVLVTLSDEESYERLPSLVRQALSQYADLAREFDAHAEEVRRQTLSLARIEERLDDIFHSQNGIALSLEAIKAILLQCAAPLGEWQVLQQARPEAVRSLVEADAHFLAGRREEGMNVLLRLFKERGVGQATLCRRLGGAWLGTGELKEAAQCLQQVTGPDGQPPAAVAQTLTSLTGASTHGSQLPVWRSLPRGFVVEERWRIDTEVGRGGMASVYRVEGIDEINQGQVAALKIPAPGLFDAPASRQRFIQEIQISQKLSRGHHHAIVETIGHVRFVDPLSKRTLYGLVLEFIDGQSLAHWLAQHQAREESLSVKEIERILQSVCDALEHAHSQSPPILHRDLKPHNIMVTRDGAIKLMDFGIARVLEDRRQTLTGNIVGTWGYLPPEFLNPNHQPDVRSDVYLAANLLVELLTFHPQGNPEQRPDCPKAWLELISDAMSRVMSKRPASIREFQDRMRAGLSPKSVRLEPLQPLTVTVASSTTLTVRVIRQNFDLPLEVGIDGLPSTLTAPASRIPKGDQEVRVSLNAAAGASTGTTKARVVVRPDGLEPLEAPLEVMVIAAPTFPKAGVFLCSRQGTILCELDLVLVDNAGTMCLAQLCAETMKRCEAKGIRYDGTMKNNHLNDLVKEGVVAPPTSGRRRHIDGNNGMKVSPNPEKYAGKGELVVLTDYGVQVARERRS